MQILTTTHIPDDQLKDLDLYAAAHAGPEMCELLQSLSRLIRKGAAFTMPTADETYTPSEVAERLGMSRTHLYKLLDRGEIPFHRVGRDRRSESALSTSPPSDRFLKTYARPSTSQEPTSTT